MARLASVAVLLLLASGHIFAQSNATPTAQQLLNDPHLWGKDFGPLKAQIVALQSVGPKFEVQPDKVIGSRELSHTQGVLAAEQLNKVFARQSMEMVAAPISAETPISRAPFSSQTSRVAITKTEAGKPQFLAPDLTTGSVLSSGKPDSVDHETIAVGVEGRPEVITTYSYAGGAIVFQTSNYSPRSPKTGDRVIESVSIDTTKLGTAK